MKVINNAIDLYQKAVSTFKRKQKEPEPDPLPKSNKQDDDDPYAKRLAPDSQEWRKELNDKTFEDVRLDVYFEMLDTKEQLVNARMKFTRKVTNHSNKAMSAIPLQYIPDDERETVDPQVIFHLVDPQQQTNKNIDYGEDIIREVVRRDGSHRAVFKLKNPIRAGKSATVGYVIEHHNSSFRPYLNVSAQYAPIRVLTIKFRFHNGDTGSVWRTIWGHGASHSDLDKATLVKLLPEKDGQYTTTFYNVPMCTSRVPGITWKVTAKVH